MKDNISCAIDVSIIIYEFFEFCFFIRNAHAPWSSCLLLRIILLVGMRRAEHKPL